MSDEKITIRDLRKGDWYWISKVLLDEYGATIGPIGIAIYNCLAEHANQEGFCFPSHKYMADKIGASVSSVQRGIRQLIKLEIIRKSRRRYHNVYYLLKLDRSERPNSIEIGQSDLQIGQSDRSVRSVGTRNNTYKQKRINKNGSGFIKIGDNLKEVTEMLAQKMSVDGAKIKYIDGKKHVWTVRGWMPLAGP